MEFRVIGVYPVDAPEPVHLLEVRVTGWTTRPDLSEITQADRSRSTSDWQVPYDEQYVNADGTGLLNPERPDEPPTDQDLRMVFFFHYLQVGQPLLTPAGQVDLPEPSEMPPRLGFVQYKPLC